MVAIEVKSSSADNTDGYEKFKELYAEHITSAFIVGPEGLPLEDFFSIDLKTMFRQSCKNSKLWRNIVTCWKTGRNCSNVGQNYYFCTDYAPVDDTFPVAAFQPLRRRRLPAHGTVKQ